MKKFLSAIVLTLSTPVMAQTSFLGIDLDTPFPAKMKECPKSNILNMVDHDLIKEAGTCYFIEQPNTYTIYNGPDLGIEHLLMVKTYVDKPIVFSFAFNKTKYAQAVDTFTTRYGKPQRTSRETVRTRAGEAFDSRTNIWEVKNLRIKIDEIGKDVRWSDAEIVNVPVMNSMINKNKEAAKAAASKL